MVLALGLGSALVAQQPTVQPPVIPPVPDSGRKAFVVVQVDGDRLSLEVIGSGPSSCPPDNGTAKIVLSDRVS